MSLLSARERSAGHVVLAEPTDPDAGHHTRRKAAMASGKYLMRALRLTGVNAYDAGKLASLIVRQGAELVDGDVLACRICRPYLHKPTSVQCDTAANIVGAVQSSWKEQGVPFDPIEGVDDVPDSPDQLMLPLEGSHPLSRQYPGT
jgi:hypothetical protein